MAIEVITEFVDVGTVWILAYIYDVDDALVDPTAITIDIYDPDATQQVDGGTMTKYNGTTGVFENYYHKGSGEDAMDKGEWRGLVLVADGTGASAIYSTGSFGFTVK